MATPHPLMSLKHVLLSKTREEQIAWLQATDGRIKDVHALMRGLFDMGDLDAVMMLCDLCLVVWTTKDVNGTLRIRGDTELAMGHLQAALDTYTLMRTRVAKVGIASHIDTLCRILAIKIEMTGHANYYPLQQLISDRTAQLTSKEKAEWKHYLTVVIRNTGCRVINASRNWAQTVHVATKAMAHFAPENNIPSTQRAETYTLRAEAYMGLGQYTEAADDYIWAVRILEARYQGDNIHMAKVMVATARSMAMLARRKEAIDLLHRVVALYANPTRFDPAPFETAKGLLAKWEKPV